MKDFEADDRTDNPTVIADLELIHPEDYARISDEMNTMARLMTLLTIQNLATKQGDAVSIRKIHAEMNEIYEDRMIYKKRVRDSLKWLQKQGLISHTMAGPGDRTTYDYKLTPEGKGYLKRHAELVLGLINGYDYDEIINEGL